MSDRPDARTPSDHHQDAQDALVEDRSMRPPNAMRFRRDFHQEDARERAQEDDDAHELIVQPNGRVSLILGDLSLHFPSLPAYDAWQETVDRSRAALGQQQALKVVP